ncbi:MAG: sensor histidine kinase [Rhodoferax sp.]
MNFRTLSVFLAFVLLACPGRAVCGVVASGKGAVDIVADAELLRDRDGMMGIHQIAQIGSAPGNSFQSLPGAFSQGFTRDTFWLRLRVSRAAGEPMRWWLVAEPTFIDDLRLYLPDGHGGYSEQRAGDHVPVSQRPMATRETIFAIDLPEAPQTIYLRVQSTSTLALSLALWQPEAWVAGSLLRNTLHGTFFGMMLAAALISLVSAIWLRQKFFLVATAYVLSYGLQHLAINGYDQIFFYPEAPLRSDYAIGAASTLVPALFLFFSLLYLESSRYLPRLSKLVNAVAWISVGAIAFSLAGYYPAMAPHMPVYVAMLLVLVIALIVRMLPHEPHRAKFMLLMFLPGGIALIPQMLRNLGWLPLNLWTTYLWSLSIFLQLPFVVLMILQRVREESNKLRAAISESEAQRSLMGTIGHELRTPLAIVEAGLANIEARTADGQPELRPRFERIALALARLNRLIDNALAEETLRGGAIVIHPAPLAPSALLAQVSQLSGLAESGRLVLALPADDSPVVLDAHWLGLAVLNLIDNAVKYSRRGSAITLSAERAEARLVIRVRDHGIGIAAQDLPRLGERFFRADNARNLAGAKGLGLGLHLVRQVTTCHGGTLQIDSVPHQGSCFSIEIPVQRAHP